jgi:hypothetical protein
MPSMIYNYVNTELIGAKSFPCRTSKIFACKSFSYRTYKNKGLITPLFAAHTKKQGVFPYPFAVLSSSFHLVPGLDGVALDDR